MGLSMMGRLREAFKRLNAGVDSRLNLDDIDRYWRVQRGGDRYLDAYQQARLASGSTDDLAKQLRFHTLMQAVNHVLTQQVVGDVVECGCWRGHSARMIADRLLQARWQGHFRVFDSFEGGLSDKTPEDRELYGNTDPQATLMQKQLFTSRKSAVAQVLQHCKFVSLHEGWIPDVFAQVVGLNDRRYALVHIDVDLYQPTLAALNQFGPRMAEGGIIVIDDYASSHFPGATRAVDEYREIHPPRLALEGHTGGMLLCY